MGCNIHLHTEVKIDGAWHHYNCPSVDRNYQVFAKMAGVRSYGDIEPIALPRGTPSDASELTKFSCAYLGSDGHSHSWLSAEEISLLIEYINEDLKLIGQYNWPWHYNNFGYFFGNSWRSFWDDIDSVPTGVQDVRFIFWFDN